MTVSVISWFVSEKKPDRNQRVMEDRHHGRHAIDQLKAEPQVDQHAHQRVDRRQKRLVRQLLSRGRAHDVHLLHGKAGVVIVGVNAFSTSARP